MAVGFEHRINFYVPDTSLNDGIAAGGKDQPVCSFLSPFFFYANQGKICRIVTVAGQ